jgi:hypothetical protein
VINRGRFASPNAQSMLNIHGAIACVLLAIAASLSQSSPPTFARSLPLLRTFTSCPSSFSLFRIFVSHAGGLLTLTRLFSVADSFSQVLFAVLAPCFWS